MLFYILHRELQFMQIITHKNISQLNFKLFISHVRNSYSEAVVGNEILCSPAPSNSVHAKCIKKKIVQVKNENLRHKT